MTKSNIACIILAGGQSRRFGSPKGLAQLDSASLLDIIYAKLRQQTNGPIWLNASLDGPYKSCGYDMVPDILKDKGPLGGIHAGMRHAQLSGHDYFLTVPIDTPYLPDNLISELRKHPAPIIAKNHDHLHPIIGIWPTSLFPKLENFIVSGKLAVKDWITHLNIRHIDFQSPNNIDPFWNINTVEDLLTPLNRGDE